MGSSLEFIKSTQTIERNQGNTVKKTLLLIESDKYLSQAFLLNDGKALYQTQKISMGESITQELERYFVEHRPDMMIVDIGLADGSELLAIKALRKHYDGLLMVVTSKSCEKEHFNVLDLGADDYLLKPLDSRILLKHIDVLFKHQLSKNNHVELASITMGDVCLQPQSQKCFINGEHVRLTTLEFNLLKSLVEHQGNILSRDELYNTLLRRQYNGVERTLDVRMSQLREKLTAAGMKGNQIETVWGQGYMLSHISA